MGSANHPVYNLATLYGGRLDLYPIVASAAAPGRPYHLFVTDERVADVLNFNAAPLNVVCMVTPQYKLAVYTYWKVGTTNVDPTNQLLEFYDYTTPGGLAETANTPGDPRVPALTNLLMNTLLPNEVRQPLPASLRFAQATAQLQWLAYRDDLSRFTLDDIHGIGLFQPGLGG